MQNVIFGINMKTFYFLQINKAQKVNYFYRENFPFYHRLTLFKYDMNTKTCSSLQKNQKKFEIPIRQYDTQYLSSSHSITQNIDFLYIVIKTRFMFM